MNNSKLSSISMMKILGCFIFDLALILAYFKVFGLFLFIAPDKSIFVLLILLVGLLALNGAIIFPSVLFKIIGVPYSASIATLLVLYVIAANILSIFLIPGSTVWYIVWELIIFAIALVIFAIVAGFSKTASENIMRDEKEQAEKASIMLQLLEIQEELAAKENQAALIPCLNSFKALKERILSSTPFGRISGNSAILEIENKIKDNLLALKIGLQGNLNNENLVQLQSLIENTRKLVVNRETLNIK